jgi:hypothetical protein
MRKINRSMNEILHIYDDNYDGDNDYQVKTSTMKLLIDNKITNTQGQNPTMV